MNLSHPLAKRVITALVLIPLFLGALFGLTATGVAILFGAIIAIGAWEWGGLAGLARATRAQYAMAVPLLGAWPVAMLLTRADLSWLSWVLAANALFWLWALVDMVRRSVPGQEAHGLYGSRLGKVLSGFAILVPAWLAAVYLVVTDGQRPALLLYAVALVWTADTFAYFAGHRWGKHKLAPSVSPGKTIEGVVGGFAGAMILAGLAGMLVWRWSGGRLALWLTVSAVAALVSVLGDLVESKFKRLAGVKDSGTILPGHGGVLDRIDALTSALPVFALGWLVLHGRLS
jgi:phosphatidate cytidylyltransferase